MARSVRAPKDQPAGDTRQRILDAAAAEFAAKGFDGARLGSIARAVGIRPSLIHHYFDDKQGLHAEILRSGIATMVEDAWRVVSQMSLGSESNANTLRGPSELRALADAYVGVLLTFLATNGALMAMLRHEVRDGARGRAATKAVSKHVAPLFEATAAKIDEMKARGEVRADVDSRELLLSIIAMVTFPFEDEAFVALLWPRARAIALRERVNRRKEHVVAMILAAVLP